jgi:CheY-like chemotaxis protein
VVVLSAIRGQGDYPATLGVAAWFTKPLDADRFLGAIEQLADRSREGRPSGPAAGTGARTRILIVEDEVLIRTVLTEYLKEEGYAPETARSIEEAVPRIGEDPPDLLLLDLMLPGSSGWDFLRRRRDDPSLQAIPVLVLSAAPQDRLLEAKELGADGFLSKPFDLDVLGALLRSFVR